MLRVALVAYPFACVDDDPTGGAEQVLSALDRALVAAGHRSIVLACSGSRAAGELVPLDVGAGPIDDERRALAAASIRAALHALLARRAVDVIHFHGVDCLAYLPDAGAARGVAQLVTLHLPIEWYGPALRRAPPGLAVSCVSAWQRAHAPAWLAPRCTIDNGVDLERYVPASQPARERALCLGRICPEKGYERALDGARLAGVPLELAGELFAYAEHERYFAEHIRPRLDAERCHVGPVAGEAKRRLLAHARCLVVPSHVAETSSLVTMEALASGTPVITSSAGAPHTLIEPGVTGFVADDEQAIAEALARVDALDRRRCRAAAERRFDVRTMTRGYIALYHELAALPG